jgi:dipeptidyl aminopeptidase/acylaminoacyl peptidase
MTTPLLEDARRRITDWFTQTTGPSVGVPSDAAELAVSPDQQLVAFTAAHLSSLETLPGSRIALLDLRSGSVTTVSDGPGTDRAPAWSPDGNRLAFLCDSTGTAQLLLRDVAAGETRTTPAVDGTVEALSWSPDGGCVALLVAGQGAELAGVQGSGRTAAATTGRASWEPTVDNGDDPGRWRRVHLHDLGSGTTTCVSPADLNVWELSFLRSGVVAVVATPTPDEGAWYDADLRLLDLSTGEHRLVHTPRHQVGLPAASPDGRHVAVVEGLASDRAVVMGDAVVVDTESATASIVDSDGIDVGHVAWRDEQHLLLAGHRGEITIVAESELASGKLFEHWVSEDTCGGRVYPAAWPLGADEVILVRESWERPPEIAAGSGELRLLASMRQPGCAVVREGIGSAGWLRWTAPDGRAVSGRLTVPSGDGPFPLVVEVHGGPVWCTRNTWLQRHGLIPFLVSQGYAVLQPNPRGSSGWGHEFRELVLGDMGGDDVADVLSGIDQAVRQGTADPARIAVIGGSYGGYMTYVLTSRDPRFAAAVAVCPVSDYYAAEYTCNIPEFISRFLDDEPENATGRYRTRSPIHDAAQVRTPTLHVVGRQDRCAPPTQGEFFHRALLAHGSVPSTYVEYPEEGHGIRTPPAMLDFRARVLDWFDHYLRSST